MVKLDINKMLEQIPNLDELTLYCCFKQYWGTSATAFLEPGYFAPQCVTEAYTTIFEKDGRCYVFIDNDFCYSVLMSEEFQEDIKREAIRCKWDARIKYDGFLEKC